jgi:polyphenol oxidase
MSLTAHNPRTALTPNSGAGLQVIRPAVILPDWPAPASVGALMSTRMGGVSTGPYASLNLGRSVGDDPAAVAQNRQRFVDAVGVPTVWLHLVHGAGVLRITSANAAVPPPPADAAWTSERGIACVVQAADCLPVLFALRDGSAVAAAHAGWRGLAAGVLQATVQALCEGTGAAPADVMAWLGPCIGPRQFEVGADVLQALGSDEHCTSRPRPDGSPRWLADLPALARGRLSAAGLRQINAAQACTFEDASRFFSFRRDGVTGRMAAAVWRH